MGKTVSQYKKFLIEAHKALKKKDGVIVYPTNTIWGIGCAVNNEVAISKIFEIKNRSITNKLICLVNGLKMLSSYVDLTESNKLFIKQIKEPTTIIFDSPKNLSQKLISKDNTIAFRIVQEGFSYDLITSLELPITSTSANVSGESFPKMFSEISNEILKKVTYSVNLYDGKEFNKPSKIVMIETSGSIKQIR